MTTSPLAELVNPADLRAVSYLAAGLTVTEVAALEGCGRGAIDSRVYRVRKAVGATSTAHAVVLLIRAGLLDLSQLVDMAQPEVARAA